MEEKEHEILQLPVQADGSEYKVDMLGEDQLEVFTKVMVKLEEWMKDVRFHSWFTWLPDLQTAFSFVIIMVSNVDR